MKIKYPENSDFLSIIYYENENSNKIIDILIKFFHQNKK
jgi:hypothetical protein